MAAPLLSEGSIPGPVFSRLRQARPVVHAITNIVVTTFVANVLLAAGASPVMASAVEEVAGFTDRAGALAVNLGTLNPAAADGIRLAVRTANQRNLPWALDPVGVGASTYRLALARELLAMRPTVIRGNADEILALAGMVSQTSHGVDSASGSAEALESAQRLSDETGAVVVLTGETDFIVSAGVDPVSIKGGHAMSRDVAGLGCATTALVAALLAVAAPREAAVAGAWLMKAAAGAAGRRSSSPGGFAAAVLDAIHAESRRVARPPLGITLYGILDPQIAQGRSLAVLARQAAEAGVDILQYRAKEAGTRDMIAEAGAIVATLQGSGVPLVVNDRVDVALASGAQGVHLGRDDMSPSQHANCWAPMRSSARPSRTAATSPPWRASRSTTAASAASLRRPTRTILIRPSESMASRSCDPKRGRRSARFPSGPSRASLPPMPLSSLPSARTAWR